MCSPGVAKSGKIGESEPPGQAGGIWALFIFNVPTGLAPGAIEKDPTRIICIPILDWSLAARTNKCFEPLVFNQKPGKTKYNKAAQHYGSSNPFRCALNIKEKTKCQYQRQRKRRDPHLQALRSRTVRIKALHFLRWPNRLWCFKSFCGPRFDRGRKKRRFIEPADGRLRGFGWQHDSRAAAARFP